MADTHVQTTRLKVPAPARSGFQHPAQGAGIPSDGMPPTGAASLNTGAQMVEKQSGKKLNRLAEMVATSRTTLAFGS